jgi:hypothetical protein
MALRPATSTGASCSSASTLPVFKVNAKWKKLVKSEFARLCHKRKMKHQDDIKIAWKTNRKLLDDGGAVANQNDAYDDGDGEQLKRAGKRSRPTWSCSEEKPALSQFFRKVEVKSNSGKSQTGPIKVYLSSSLVLP